MGLFDGRSYSESEHLRPQHSSSHRARSTSRGGSPTRSSTGFFARPAASSRSGSNYNAYGSSSRGIFSGGGGNGGSSYYKRRPRDGYISSLMHKLQRMIKELWSYARRHPVKAFFAVVVPLLSAGGAIHGLLKQFGVRIPMMGGQASRMAGGYYGSAGYGGGSSGGLGGLGKLAGLGGQQGGGGGWMNNAGSIMTIAKAFM